MCFAWSRFFASFYNYNVESLSSDPISVDKGATSAYVGDADMKPESTTPSVHCMQRAR